MRKINGRPVVDARKSVVLTITHNDIAKGKLKSPSGCAAAVACKRQLKATEARVHVGRVYLRFNGKWHRYLTSKPLRSEIVAFDRGGTFEAGDYLLMKMQPSRKFDKKFRNPLNTGGRGKRRTKYHIITNVRPVGVYA